MSRNSYFELYQAASTAPTAVGNTTTETILVPDLVLPANYFIQGSSLRHVCYFQISNVVTSTPTITFRYRMGTSTLSGTAVLTSGALTCINTAQTNLSGFIEMDMTCRTNGTAGTVMWMGRAMVPNLTAGSTAGTAGWTQILPASAPATATLDSTAVNVISCSVQWSAANASNTIQAMVSKWESQN